MCLENEVRMEDGAPFPPEMQGRWIEIDEPEFQIVIRGPELIWNGDPIVYLAKCIERYDDVGACWVRVIVPDQMSSGDALCMFTTPENTLHAFSDHFAANFEKAK